jgi:glycosyltransferase involved in cell wall biosynthesis
VKICLLLSTFTYDGIKRSVVHFANAMHAMGHEVWVGVLHEWPGKVSLRSELRIPAEHVVSWDGLGQIRRELAVYRFLKKQAFDVVHTNTIKMNHLGRWTARAAGIPCILASEDNLCLKRSLKTRLEDRLLARLTDGVVMISQAVADSFIQVEKLPPQKVHVIYYGLPVDQLRAGMVPAAKLLEKRQTLGIPAGPLIVCAARLHFSKSLDTLIESARHVRMEIPDAQFLLVGDGDEDARLRAKIKEVGIGSCFHMPGAREDIYEILQLADIVTLPSLWEGLGFSLMEAMAFGKPVVGTDVSGINEIIDHGVNGLLVPTVSPVKLARAFIKILKDPLLHRAMGEQALEIVRRKFDAAQNASKLVDLYQSILNGKR